MRKPREFTRKQIDFIQNRAAERIGEVFDSLDIEYVERIDYLQAPCPVHGGDNPRGMFWAMQSSHWQCKTQGCHKAPVTGPSSSVFGLVRGAMVHKTGERWTFQQAVRFVAKVLSLQNLEMDAETEDDIEVSKAVRQYRRRQKNQPVKRGKLLIDFLPHLQPDTAYYPQRGVVSEIIARYHISFCNTKGKPFYKRAFFPILDDTGRYVVGWSGRSIYEKCEKCKMHHHPDRAMCPDAQYGNIYVKWKHSFGFHGEDYLYNYWYAKPFITKTGTAVICEGPGDVWAFETAGVRNSVALLGLNVSQQQRLLLQNAGALTLVFVLDNDKAGRAAQKRFEETLKWYFRLIFVTPDGVNDVGDMVPDDLRNAIVPVLQQVSKAKMLAGSYKTKEEA